MKYTAAMAAPRAVNAQMPFAAAATKALEPKYKPQPTKNTKIHIENNVDKDMQTKSFHHSY